MAKVITKPKQLFNILGIAFLIGISTISWAQSGWRMAKFNTFLSCDGDSSDTIIMDQERSRTRVFFDTLKKGAFIDWVLPYSMFDFQPMRSVELRSLFVNTYQRNVFYIYASFSVP